MATKKKRRKFEEWEYSQIHKEFGYKRHYKNFPFLETWEMCQEPVSDEETKRLEILSERLFYYVETWNEDELKLLFISPVIELVDFYNSKYKIFTQRRFVETIAEWDVAGIVDLVIAQGEQHPEQPFFFLHEYKQERKRDNDPLGQLLIAMLVAQQRNEVDRALYGCYVVGRLFFFVAMQGKDYSVSRAYDGSLAHELLTIFRMFRFVRREIESH